MEENEDKIGSSDDLQKKVPLINEFLIDILGCFMPGVIFYICLFTIFIPPIVGLSFLVGKNINDYFSWQIPIDSFLESVKGTPYMLWFSAFGVNVIVAYILGDLFYRRDPKEPNRASFRRMLKERNTLLDIEAVCHNNDCDNKVKCKNKDGDIIKIECPNRELIIRAQNSKHRFLIRWVYIVLEWFIGFKNINHEIGFYKKKLISIWKFIVEIRHDKKAFENSLTEICPVKKWLRENYACDAEDNCEFPFPYLSDYLAKRGHYHLLPLVPWKIDSNNKEGNLRSKTFINMIKIRLQTYFQRQYKMIVRNEAHIRLSTSTWHMTRTLSIVAMFGFIAAILEMITIYFVHKINFDQDFPRLIVVLKVCMPFFLPPLFILVFASYAKKMSEKFIHYQRLREVFYVLELAYTVLDTKKNLLSINTEITENVFMDNRKNGVRKNIENRSILIYMDGQEYKISDISKGGLCLTAMKNSNLELPMGPLLILILGKTEDCLLITNVTTKWSKDEGSTIRFGVEFNEKQTLEDIDNFIKESF